MYPVMGCRQVVRQRFLVPPFRRFESFHPSFLKDLSFDKSFLVLFYRKRKTVAAIKNCDSDILISTRILFNNWLGAYGRKKAYKIAWEHNHHHQDMKYANKVVDSCKRIDSLVLVSDSLRNFYKRKMKEKNIK